MLQFAPSHRALRAAAGVPILCLALLAACGDSKTGTTTTASTPPAKSNAPAEPAAAMPAKPDAAAQAAEKQAAEAKAASLAAAQKLAADARAASEPLAADPHAGHDHAADAHDAHADAAATAAVPDKLNPNAGPLMPDTDPNSKARINYEFGKDIVNFGRVMQGDILHHSFMLEAGGEEPLIIKQAKPTCGCTVAQLMAQDPEGNMVPYQFNTPIPVGRKIEIGATLATQGKRGHAGSKINVITNDPRGQTILSLEADVEPFFTVNPPSINFNQLSQKDTATERLQVATSKGQRVKLAATTDNLPQGLALELKALDEDEAGTASRWELVAIAGPGLVEGNLAYSVPMRSDLEIPGGTKMANGQMPTYEVSATVMARVTGPISYNPQFVSLGLVRPGTALSRTIRVTCHDPEFTLGTPAVAILGRESEPWEHASSFTAVVRPVANENAIDVEISTAGMPATLNGSFSGVLSIQIGHPDKPELKIPISGVVRGGGATPPPTPGTPGTPPTPVAPPK